MRRVSSLPNYMLNVLARPDLLSGPGGILDIRAAKYEQISTRGVRVSGAVIQRKPTAFKLEGARMVGYKTVFLGGIRDPIMIRGIDAFVSHEFIPGANGRRKRSGEPQLACFPSYRTTRPIIN